MKKWKDLNDILPQRKEKAFFFQDNIFNDFVSASVSR